MARSNRWWRTQPETVFPFEITAEEVLADLDPGWSWWLVTVSGSELVGDTSSAGGRARMHVEVA